MESPRSLSVYVPWTRVLPLLGIEIKSRILPTLVRCPLCGSHRLEILEDRLCGGQWYSCAACGRSGDMIELASKVWKLSIPATVVKLSRNNINIPVGKEEVQAYIRGRLDYRHRLANLWTEARQGLFHSSTTAYKLVHELTLACDVGDQRWKDGPGQIVGSIHHLAVEAAFNPASTGTPRQPNSNCAGNKIFPGNCWEDVLVFPFYDLPGRICGFHFIGRKANPDKDFIYRRANHAHNKSGEFEAGLAMHPRVLEMAADWNDTVVALGNPLLAAQIQIRHLERSTRPLPLVAWYIDPPNKPNRHTAACRTKQAWQMLARRKIVFWIPQLSTTSWEQAIQANGLVSQVGPKQGDETVLRQYVSKYAPQDLTRRIIHAARPWPVVMADLFAEMDDEHIEEMLLSLELVGGVNLKKLQDRCDPDLQQRITRLLSRSRNAGAIYIKGYTFYEDPEGWSVVDKQGRTATVMDAILHIEQLVTHPRSGVMYYRGHIIQQGEKIPFYEAKLTVDRKPIAWMEQVMAQRHRTLRYTSAYACHIISLAKLFHPFKAVDGAEQVGWESLRQRLVLPGYAISRTGEVESLLGHAFSAKSPGYCVPPPEPVSPRDADLALWDQETTAVVGAVVVAAIGNIIAPACHGHTCGIALLGIGADNIGRAISTALGCHIVPLRRISDLRRMIERENEHNWPIFVDFNTALPWMTTATWLGSEQIPDHNCLVPMDWWMSHVRTACGGWGLVKAEQPMSLTEDQIVAWRRIIPSYLRDLCSRNFQLHRWEDEIPWHAAILRDLQNFLSPITTRSRWLDEVTWLPPGDGEAFGAVLARLVLTGEMVVVPSGFQDPQATTMVRQEEGIFVPRPALHLLLNKHRTGWTSPLRITQAFQRSSALRGESDGGWLVEPAWFASHLKQGRHEMQLQPYG